MEHFIINHKKINIERNKEFLFKIPIRINLMDSTIIVENSNKSSEEEIIVSFYLKNLKTDLENKEGRVKYSQLIFLKHFGWILNDIGR